ncbi:MAG: NADH:quinone oxidoreductase [Pseudomonadota bacterium]
MIAFLLLLLVLDWRLLSALMLGGAIAAVGVVVFPLVFCSNSTGLVEPGTAGVGAGTAPTVAAAASSPAAPSPSPSAADAPAAASVAKKTADAAETGKAKASDAAEASGAAVADTKAPPASAAPSADESQPELLKAARTGGADDLKKIKGVGPQLEKTLNEMGFFHFDQIAAWGAKEVAWVDARLKFKGRIERDEWIKQSKALAKG